MHEAIAPLFAQTIFSVHMPRADLPGPQVADACPGRGPMIGIASALQAVKTTWVFAVGCDMPRASAKLLHFMAGCRPGVQAVVAEVGGKVQPLPGFYADSCLPVMQEAIEKGERGLARLIAHRLDAAVLPESELRQCDPTLQSFVDFDTRQSLERCGSQAV